MNQPIMPLGPPVVDDRQEQRNNIVDTLDGRTASLPATSQTVILHATGQKQIIQETTEIVTHDGTIVPTTTKLLGMCRSCNRGPFSADAITRCRCGRLTCKRCARQGATGLVCPGCWWIDLFIGWWNGLWKLP